MVYGLANKDADPKLETIPGLRDRLYYALLSVAFYSIIS
jgi:hypothetical protein